MLEPEVLRPAAFDQQAYLARYRLLAVADDEYRVAVAELLAQLLADAFTRYDIPRTQDNLDRLAAQALVSARMVEMAAPIQIEIMRKHGCRI